MENDITYGDFFLKAPSLNPNRKLIKGSVCGIKVEEITEPLMQEIRYLDKLVEDFPVNNITIFERKGGKWETAWSGEL